MALKRIRRELKDAIKYRETLESCDFDIIIEPLQDDHLQWIIYMRPPPHSFYDYADYFNLELSCKFPPDYPFKPPKIKFESSIVHPILHNGASILGCKNWSPALTVLAMLLRLVWLLLNPINCEDQLTLCQTKDSTIGACYTRSRHSFVRRARPDLDDAAVESIVEQLMQVEEAWHRSSPLEDNKAVGSIAAELVEDIPPEPTEDQKKIYIKTLTGRTIPILISFQARIAHLKARLEAEGFPAKQQKLVYCGKQMDNQCTLAEYNVYAQASLHLVVPLRECRGLLRLTTLPLLQMPLPVARHMRQVLSLLPKELVDVVLEYGKSAQGVTTWSVGAQAESVNDR